MRNVEPNRKSLSWKKDWEKSLRCVEVTGVEHF